MNDLDAVFDLSDVALDSDDATAGDENDTVQETAGTPLQGDATPTCALDAPKWAGPLCGPPNQPCQASVIEVLPPHVIQINAAAPAIAVSPGCTPYVLFGPSEQGNVGYFSRRDAPHDWQSESTPFEMDAGTLLFDGLTAIAVVDGSSGILVAKRQDGWKVVSKPGWQGLSQPGVAMDVADGSIHAIVNTAGTDALLGKLSAAGVWTTTPFGDSSSQDIALGANGTLQATSWRYTGTWRLLWQSPESAFQPIVDLETSPLTFPEQRLTISKSTGDPTVYFGRETVGGSGLREMAVAVRTAPKVWTTSILDSETASKRTGDCSKAPGVHQCEIETASISMLDAVSSESGDTRILYVKHRRVVQVTVTCVDNDEFHLYCTEEMAITDKHTLRMAWRNPDDTTLSVPVADDVDATEGTATVDGVGTIHIAWYHHDHLATSIAGTSVRYIQLRLPLPQ